MKIIDTTIETVSRLHVHILPDQNLDEVCKELKSRGFKVLHTWRTTVKTTIIAEKIVSIDIVQNGISSPFDSKL